MELEDRIKRWRLILGEESEAGFSAMGDTSLSGEQDLMDQALAAIYDNTSSGGGFGARGAGKGPSAPVVSKWLDRFSTRNWYRSSRQMPWNAAA